MIFEDGTRLNVRQHGHQIDVANYWVMELQQGDKVQLMANDKKRGLFNGDVYTIQSWNRDGSIKTVEGKDIPADFLGLAHGYVFTSHKSQGKTADHVVVAAEKLNSKACYVASSRGRESATIHTVDKDRLYAGLPQSEDRLSVSDVLRATQANDRYKLLKTLDDPREIIRRYWESGPNSNPLILTQTPDPAEIERKRQQNSGPSFGR